MIHRLVVLRCDSPAACGIMKTEPCRLCCRQVGGTALGRSGRAAITMLILFRSRLRDENDPEYETLAPRMLELARSMPGFVSFKAFSASDGERVSIIEFESEDTLKAWREHPEHRNAQERGRNSLYSEYSLQVCRPLRESRFDRPQEPD